MKKGILICLVAILILSTMLFAGCSYTVYNQNINIESNEDSKDTSENDDTNVTDEDNCKEPIAYNQEIMINSNLENKSADWTYFTDEDLKVTYTEKVLTAGTTDYEEESANHGRTYIGIDSKTAGSYGYFSQEVALDKNAFYILSVDVKITSKISTEGDFGAFVGLAESSQISQSITGLLVGWHTIMVCFKNNSYDKVNVRFGLGTETSEVTKGYAYFDNISLKKIKDPATEAAGLVVFDLGIKSTIQ